MIAKKSLRHPLILGLNTGSLQGKKNQNSNINQTMPRQALYTDKFQRRGQNHVVPPEGVASLNKDNVDLGGDNREEKGRCFKRDWCGPWRFLVLQGANCWKGVRCALWWYLSGIHIQLTITNIKQYQVEDTEPRANFFWKIDRNWVSRTCCWNCSKKNQCKLQRWVK